MTNVIQLNSRRTRKIDLTDADHIPQTGERHHVVELETRYGVIVLDFGAAHVPEIDDPSDRLLYMRDVVLRKRDVPMDIRAFAHDVITAIIQDAADRPQHAHRLRAFGSATGAFVSPNTPDGPA